MAACNRVGNAYILNGTGPGWGDLVRSRGVTIEPGQTRTFDVSEAVPEAALNRGFVAVACDFGYDEVDIDNHANAEDRAAVPGAFGTVVGDVVYHPGQGKPQQAVAGVKVVLVDERHCPVVGEQTTDANGHFEFHHVLPGPDYHLYLLPPKGWKIKFENPTSIDVSGPEGNPSRVGIEAEPGDAPLPTVPTQPADCGASGTPTTTAPAQGGGSGGQGSSGLALTGADVITFGAVGLVALAIGAGLVLAARRRRRVTG